VFLDALEEHVGPEIMEDTMGLWETIEKTAKAQGKAEGKAEGRLEGARETLLTLLGRRLGEISAATEKAVERMDLAELDAALERFVNGSTLDEVVG